MPFLLSQIVEKAANIFVTLAQQGMILWHSLYGLCIFLSEEEMQHSHCNGECLSVKLWGVTAKATCVAVAVER